MKDLVMKCAKCNMNFDYRQIAYIPVMEKGRIPFIKRRVWTEVCRPCKATLLAGKRKR